MKLIKINEELETNLDDVSIQGVEGAVYTDAIKVHQKRKEETKKALKEVEKNSKDFSEKSAKRESLNKGSLKESFESDKIMDDLVDRAMLILKDGDGDLSDAVAQALDDGLVYAYTVFTLAPDYLSQSEVLDMFYENLYNDVYSMVSEKIEDEGQVEESLNENANSDLANFLKDAKEFFETEELGCMYYNLGGELYAVVGKDDENTTVVKIAYNSDDLQSDYDYDWSMPTYKDGDVAFVEVSLDDNTDFNGLAKYLQDEANAMNKEIEKGNLLLEGCDLKEDWHSYTLDKTNAQRFKSFLRKNEIYFEPSSDGEYIHFEVDLKDDDKKARVEKYFNALKSLTEAPIYDLNPEHDSRKSFYNKAKVDVDGNKNVLYSYNTKVAEIIDGKPVVYGTYSQTTLRHIKEWLKQLGFKAENNKQIMADYGVQK